MPPSILSLHIFYFHFGITYKCHLCSLQNSNWDFILEKEPGENLTDVELKMFEKDRVGYRPLSLQQPFKTSALDADKKKNDRPVLLYSLSK